MNLDSVYNQEDQISSLWDLKINTLDGSFDKLKFKVQDVSFPFPQINVKRKFSGETAFEDFTEVDAVTLTLRESPDFSSYTFFKKWMDIFYDEEKRVFNTFTDYKTYKQYLYGMTITFYEGSLLTTSLPLLEDKFAKPSFIASCIACKPIGISALSLSYDGGPLIYSLSIQPETVKLTK